MDTGRKENLTIDQGNMGATDEGSTDERTVLDELSEHFKQINEILALVESEHSREVELAVNCDSLERLSPPNQANLASPGLQSSLTSPLNCHVIDDLIRDSVQNDGDCINVISQDYSNASGDTCSSESSADDPESRTRRTLQTLAQLAELVDKNNLAISTESLDYCSSKQDSNIEQQSKDTQRPSLATFRPTKPILLVSKVKAGEKLKRRKIADLNRVQKQKLQKLSENSESKSSMQTLANSSISIVNADELQKKTGLFTNNQQHCIMFLQCDNNQIIPVVFIPNQPEPSNSTNTASNQHVIDITLDSDTDKEITSSTSCANRDSQPVVLVPPVITIDDDQSDVLTVTTSNSSINTNVQDTQLPIEVASQHVAQNVTAIIDSTSSSIGDSLQESLIADTSSDGSELSIHLKSNKEEFKCQYCSAVFSRFCNFSKHLLVHNVFFSEDDVYKCAFCDRRFLQRCDLNRHLLVHNGTEPHRCEICNKAYIRKSDLVVHLRYHTKERPFSCKICNKGFAQTGDLSRHIRRVHDKTAPIRCGHCKRKYATEATLIRHMKVAHQDFILKNLMDQQQVQQQK